MGRRVNAIAMAGVTLCLAVAASAPRVNAHGNHHLSGLCDDVIEAERVFEGQVVSKQPFTDAQGHRKTRITVSIRTVHRWPSGVGILSTYTLDVPGGLLANGETIRVPAYDLADLQVGDVALFVVPAPIEPSPYPTGPVPAADVIVNIQSYAVAADHVREVRERLASTEPGSTEPPPSSTSPPDTSAPPSTGAPSSSSSSAPPMDRTVSTNIVEQRRLGESVMITMEHNVQLNPGLRGLPTWDATMARVAACTGGD